MSILEVEQQIRSHGFEDFRWLDTSDIIVSQWVRMKCIFGCSDYGKAACCPPQAPSITDCREFFREYRHAVLLHIPRQVSDPQELQEWMREMTGGLLALEKAVFLAGYHKAFVLLADSCNLCANGCVGNKTECRMPKLARPCVEAFGMDVFATARRCGYPIQVLADGAPIMNRYALLLIE